MKIKFQTFLFALLLIAFGFTQSAFAWQKSYSNGVYQGQQRGGKPHGQGVYKWNSGRKAYYKGSFAYGKFGGLGTLYYRDGGRCFGKFNSKLQINSNAQCRFGSGAKYHGNMSGGKRHLYGTYTYPTGSVYAGHWRHGKQHGKAVYTRIENGQRIYRYKGYYRNGKKHGWGGLWFFKSGKYYCIKKVNGETVQKRKAAPNSSCR